MSSASTRMMLGRVSCFGAHPAAATASRLSPAVLSSLFMVGFRFYGFMFRKNNNFRLNDNRFFRFCVSSYFEPARIHRKIRLPRGSRIAAGPLPCVYFFCSFSRSRISVSSSSSFDGAGGSGAGAGAASFFFIRRFISLTIRNTQSARMVKSTHCWMNAP